MCLRWTFVVLTNYIIRLSNLWDSVCVSAAEDLETMNMTLSEGCLGSGNDEERSEMRYVMRIAEFSESSNL